MVCICLFWDSPDPLNWNSVDKFHLHHHLTIVVYGDDDDDEQTQQDCMEGPGNDSSSRATILGSLLRGRPRQISQSDLIIDYNSGSAASNDPRRRTMAPNLLNTASNNNNNSGGGSSGFDHHRHAEKTTISWKFRQFDNTAGATPAPPIATSATAAAALGFNNYTNNNNNNYNRPTTSRDRTLPAQPWALPTLLVLHHQVRQVQVQITVFD
jgi:hypothetical protein